MMKDNWPDDLTLTIASPWCPTGTSRGEEYCPRDEPNYYMLVQYPLPIDRSIVDEKRRQLADKYYLWGTVMVNDAPHMEIYARSDRVEAGRNSAPRMLDESEFSAIFNERMLGPFSRNGPIGDQQVSTPANYRFGDHIQLLGYDLKQTTVKPGGELEVVLYWTASDEVDDDYYVSVQIVDLTDGSKAGQRDGEPGCNRFPTASWVPGDRILDRYHVPIPSDAQPGKYVLYITMYRRSGSDGVSGDFLTLPVTDDNGETLGGAALTVVTVEPE